MGFLASKNRPDYFPDEFGLPENYNVLTVSEIHAFEESDRGKWSQYDREHYRRRVGDQLQRFSDRYKADEIWILGDTGSTDDLLGVLNRLEPGPEVTVVAGDEDKVPADKERKPWTGFFEQIDEPQPYSLDIDYRIRDECFKTSIHDFEIQAAHHPKGIDRSDLQNPDPRPPETVEEFFTVEKELNSEMVDKMISEPRSKPILPSLIGLDAVFYDHVHMAYPREVQGTAVVGLGGRRNSYQRGADCIPESSLHLSSFNENIMHQLQFDADTEEINEHVIFEKDRDSMEMYDGAYLEEGKPPSYKTVQTRFHKDHINPKAVGDIEEQTPPLWVQKEK